MRRRPTRPRAAFTMLELVASLTLIAIIAGVLAPVLTSAGDELAATRRLRAASDDAFFALNAVTRLLREAPAGVTTRLGLAQANATGLTFTDARGVRLNGQTLEILDDAGRAAPVARAVTEFRIDYLDDDGVTPAQPADAHRFHVTLTVNGMTLTGVVFPRVNTGSPA